MLRQPLPLPFLLVILGEDLLSHLHLLFLLVILGEDLLSHLHLLFLLVILGEDLLLRPGRHPTLSTPQTLLTHRNPNKIHHFHPKTIWPTCPTQRPTIEAGKESAAQPSLHPSPDLTPIL